MSRAKISKTDKLSLEDDGVRMSWISPQVLADPDEFETAFFSETNCDMLYDKILELLRGKHRDGGDIIIPYPDMLATMRGLLYQNPWMNIDRLNQQVITAIVSKMIAEQEDYKILSEVDLPAIIHWDVNRGVERINEIKLNRRRPNTLEFNMRF